MCNDSNHPVAPRVNHCPICQRHVVEKMDLVVQVSRLKQAIGALLGLAPPGDDDEYEGD